MAWTYQTQQCSVKNGWQGRDSVTRDRWWSCAEVGITEPTTAGASLFVRQHNDKQDARRTPGIAGQPAGQLQEA